jgi:hypothetical protein
MVASPNPCFQYVNCQRSWKEFIAFESPIF